MVQNAGRRSVQTSRMFLLLQLLLINLLRVSGSYSIIGMRMFAMANEVPKVLYELVDRFQSIENSCTYFKHGHYADLQEEQKI